jgi:hypothetical protein
VVRPLAGVPGGLVMVYYPPNQPPPQSLPKKEGISIQQHLLGAVGLLVVLIVAGVAMFGGRSHDEQVLI